MIRTYLRGFPCPWGHTDSPGGQQFPALCRIELQTGYAGIPGLIQRDKSGYKSTPHALTNAILSEFL